MLEPEHESHIWACELPAAGDGGSDFGRRLLQHHDRAHVLRRSLDEIGIVCVSAGDVGAESLPSLRGIGIGGYDPDFVVLIEEARHERGADLVGRLYHEDAHVSGYARTRSASLTTENETRSAGGRGSPST